MALAELYHSRLQPVQVISARMYLAGIIVYRIDKHIGQLLLGVQKHLLGRTLFIYHSPVHKYDTGGHVTCKLQVMRHKDHCHAFFGEIPYQTLHFTNHCLVKSRCRFIKKQQGRFHCKTTRNGDTLTLTGREFIDTTGCLLGKTDLFKFAYSKQFSIFSRHVKDTHRSEHDITQHIKMRKKVV